MKIATKLTFGYLSLILLMIGVFVYQAALVHQMQSINRRLSQVSFQSSMISLQLLREVDQLEEYTRKLFITKDPGYSQRLFEMRDEFARRLSHAEMLSRSGAPRQSSAALREVWENYRASTADLEARVHAATASDADALLGAQLDLLGRLRDQVQAGLETTQHSIESEVANSAATGQRAEQVSWMAGLAALLLSCLVLIVVVRSISGHLRRLTDGTNQISQGNFGYALDDKRDDEFGMLAKSFNSMTVRLGELDQLKKDFVSYVSHELKAPLASIQETIQLLLDQLPGPLNEKQRRLLELSVQSSRRLSAMIGNLLDASRMEAGVVDYNFAPHDLVAITRGVLAQCEARAQEKGLRLEAGLPAHPIEVKCDEDRIIQVINNLLDNALKFSPEGAPLRVSVSRLAQLPEVLPAAPRRAIGSANGGFALVSVTDCGPGVPDVHKEAIFEKFHQVKRGGKISGQGAGLGLAICRSIVEAHRGAIWVEDIAGGGSRFSFLLGKVETDGAVSRQTPPIG